MAREQELLLLRQLRRKRTAEAAWSSFLHQYSGLLFQVIQEFESDYDEILDRYLYACQKLAEHDFRRLANFKRGGEDEFAAWLRAVTRNLCIDYFREKRGRRRLPRGVARLPELDHEVFANVHWDGSSVSEVFEELRTTRPQLRFSEVLDSLERIQAALRPWQLARVVAGTVRGQRAAAEEADEQIPDPRPDPEAETALRERFEVLQEELAALPPTDRLLLRLRFEMGLTLQQTAAALKLGDHREVHQRLARILEQLRGRLCTRGWP